MAVPPAAAGCRGRLGAACMPSIGGAHQTVMLDSALDATSSTVGPSAMTAALLCWPGGISDVQTVRSSNGAPLLCLSVLMQTLVGRLGRPGQHSSSHTLRSRKGVVQSNLIPSSQASGQAVQQAGAARAAQFLPRPGAPFCSTVLSGAHPDQPRGIEQGRAAAAADLRQRRRQAARWRAWSSSSG